jgi:sporulation protein YlmC with PRC-barrel domain
MPTNRFEDSRIAEGTLGHGANRISDGPHSAPEESRAISRDDIRDGADIGQPANGDHLILAARTITGDPVRNRAGDHLGKIEDIMLDTVSGRIAYAVLSFGGFMGIGDKLFAVPWRLLRIDTAEHEFVLDIDKRRLESAPGFDKHNWPDMAQPEFAEPVHRFYGEADVTRETWH